MSDKPETQSEVSPRSAKFCLDEVKAAKDRLSDWHKKADEGAAVAILQTKVAALAQLPLDWEIVLSKLTKLAGRVDKERSLSGPPSLLVDPPQGEQVVAAKPDGAGAFRVSSRKDLLRRGHA